MASVLKFHQNVILVHNGSKTENVQQLKEAFPQVRHVVIPANRGFSGGANIAVQEGLADSDWVLFLSNDCELTAPVCEPVRPGLVAPLLWRRKVGQIDSLGADLDLQKGVPHHWREKMRPEKTSRHRKFYVPGSAFWVDRESWAKVGGFNECLGTYWEDIELSLRAPSCGVDLLTDHRTQILHRIGKTCHKDRHYTTYLFQRNRFIVSWNYSQQPARFCFHYWASILGLSWRQIRRANTQNIPLIFRAASDGWRGRNSTLIQK